LIVRADPLPAKQADAAWHTLSVQATCETLATTASGLADDEAKQRLKRYGPNALPQSNPRCIVRMLIDQFADFMIIVLIAAAIISGVIGEPVDTVAIVVIVLLNTLIGVAQEWRAERAMAALPTMSAPAARINRDGAGKTLATAELLLCALLSSVVLFAVEVEKVFVRNGKLYAASSLPYR
jgi:Ca2+-transporting ATPase